MPLLSIILNKDLFDIWFGEHCYSNIASMANTPTHVTKYSWSSWDRKAPCLLRIKSQIEKKHLDWGTFLLLQDVVQTSALHLTASMASLYRALHLLQFLFKIFDAVEFISIWLKVNTREALTLHECFPNPYSSDRVRRWVFAPIAWTDSPPLWLAP